MTVRLLIVVVVVSVLSIPSLAAAQYGDITDEVRFEEELNPNEFMITGHMRAITVPDFALGLFFDEHSSTWSEGQKNFSFGGEFIWRRGSDFELGIGFDHANLSMTDALWNESDDPPEDAEWTEVDLQITSVAVSAYWFWDLTSWLTPFVGGGIGPGFVHDNVRRYGARPGSACEEALAEDDDRPPEECMDNGDPDDQQFDVDDPDTSPGLPPVVPVVNLTTGLRFNLGSNGVLKLEAGLHPYAFTGLGLGAQW